MHHILIKKCTSKKISKEIKIRNALWVSQSTMGVTRPIAEIERG